MNRLVILSFFILLITACGQAQPPVVITNQATQLVTVEVTRFITVEVTRLVVVTATYSGPTATPSPSATLKPTVDQTKTEKVDGSYMVGTEIAPGIWRSSGGSPSEECWLVIKDYSGGLVDITGELSGATIRIPAGQYMVYIGGGSGNRCTWSFLSP